MWAWVFPFTVGSGVSVTVGSGVSVTVGSGVSVTVGSGISVTVGSGVSVTVGSGVSVTVGSGVSVTVGSGVSVTVGVGVSVRAGVGTGASGGAVQAVWLAQVALAAPAILRVRVPNVCAVAGSRPVAVNPCTPRSTVSTGTPSRQTVRFAKVGARGDWSSVQVMEVGSYVVFRRSVTSCGGSGGTVTVGAGAPGANSSQFRFWPSPETGGSGGAARPAARPRWARSRRRRTSPCSERGSKRQQFR